MNRVEALLRAYASQVALPWVTGLSGGEKVWFCIYDKGDERRLRLYLPEFGTATGAARRGWREVDLTSAFAEWMAGQEYRDEYFRKPRLLTDHKLRDFLKVLARRISDELKAAGPEAVLALSGIGGLFGLLRVSEVIQAVEPQIEGRLLVFFPGEFENGNYRLLDARDGWSYRAVPILPDQGAPRA